MVELSRPRASAGVVAVVRSYVASRCNCAKVRKRWQKYDYRDRCDGEEASQLLSNFRFFHLHKDSDANCTQELLAESSITLFRLSTLGP